MSIKKLIRKLFRATIIIRVETMTAREHEIIDLTKPSREPSAEPVMASPSATLGADERRSEREISRTLSPSREATPEMDDGAIQELPGPPAIFKGKGPCRSPSPVTVSTSRVEVEVSEISGGATTATTTEASRSTTSITASSSTTPERESKPASGSPSKRKRYFESREAAVKEEPIDYDNRPSSPVVYPSLIKSEDSDDEGDDKFEFSPKKQRGSPDFDLSPIPFYRSSTPSPPAPFHHPEFPDRPALRCPKREQDHQVIEMETSTSSRNLDRLYYRCRDCPGFGSFICWADCRLAWAEGRNRGRWPRCWCGHPAREDITSERATYPDTLWYKCATDACRFRRYNSHDPLTNAEVNRYSGVQVYQLDY
ncbi:hypothetical protein F4804DRAFT_105288 [Jackrogersella minutella]|nr:hypothetical protein F4804DRAFT_105288 [Jackrogersella minutella]